MSYKVLQLSPQSARETQMRISIRGPWSVQSADFQEMSFQRFWLVYDSEREDGIVNRNALLGLALSMAISASFWTGVGLAVARAL